MHWITTQIFWVAYLSSFSSTGESCVFSLYIVRNLQLYTHTHKHTHTLYLYFSFITKVTSHFVFFYYTCIFLINYTCMHAQLLSCFWLFEIPWTVAYQIPLPMEFSRQEYWSELPFPSPGDLPDPGMEPASLVSAGGFFTTGPWRNPRTIHEVLWNSPSCFLG